MENGMKVASVISLCQSTAHNLSHLNDIVFQGACFYCNDSIDSFIEFLMRIIDFMWFCWLGRSVRLDPGWIWMMLSFYVCNGSPFVMIFLDCAGGANPPFF